MSLQKPIERKEQPVQKPNNSPAIKSTQLKPLEEAVEMAQSKVKQYLPKNNSLSDELIQDRREKAKNEWRCS